MQNVELIMPLNFNIKHPQAFEGKHGVIVVIGLKIYRFYGKIYRANSKIWQGET